MTLPYDDSNPDSILQYAKKLLKKTLRDFVDEKKILEIENKRKLKEEKGGKKSKGKYGNIIEEHYFKYEPNSHAKPDFEKAGLELKTSPLKILKNGKKVAKERLVMNIINFMEIVDEKRETSSFLEKNNKLLLIFYFYEKEKALWDYIIELVDIWKFSSEDLLMIEQDRHKIQDKIKAGKADELSEGDTFYLGACTKGAAGGNLRQQPESIIVAKQRAFSLKQSYVNIIIKSLSNQKEKVEVLLKDPSILAKESFEEYVKNKFIGYIGLSPQQIADKLGVPLNIKTKQYLAKLARQILGIKGNKIEEFEKANVTMKVIRLTPKGKLKESISFPAFDPKEIINQKRENSEVLQMMDKKFFFVVFQYDDKGELSLKKVMFRNIPYSDLDIYVRWVFDETKRRIKSGDIKHLPKISENLVSHVRPHGKNKDDTVEYPNGERDVKKCFWLDAKYIAKQIQK